MYFARTLYVRALVQLKYGSNEYGRRIAHTVRIKRALIVSNACGLSCNLRSFFLFSLSLSLSLTHTHSLTHSLTLSLSLTLTLSLSPSLTHSLTLSHSLTHSLTLSLSLSLTLNLSLSPSPRQTCDCSTSDSNELAWLCQCMG